METTARHNPDDSRYELHGDGRIVSVADYRVRGHMLIFTHTETVKELRGRGFAEKLVGFALDDVRARGYRVVPRCPFVRDYITAHPQYEDLLAA